MLSLGDIFRVTKQAGLEPFDRLAVAYYWLSNHHEGMGTQGYEDLSRLGQVVNLPYLSMCIDTPDTCMVNAELCEINECHCKDDLLGCNCEEEQ